MKNHDVNLCVSKVPIFSNLNQNELAQISKLVRHQHLKKGNLLYQLTESNNTLYIVHKGKLKVYRLLKNGREQLIRILLPGDFTGEWSIFQPDNEHQNYVEALSDAAICKIRRDDIIELLTHTPKISIQILAQMSKRLEKSEDQTATLADGSIISRITKYLTALSKASDDNQLIDLPISRKELASYLGTTPESITRNLNQLAKLNLIETINKHTVKIIDLNKLKSMN